MRRALVALVVAEGLACSGLTTPPPPDPVPQPDAPDSPEDAKKGKLLVFQQDSGACKWRMGPGPKAREIGTSSTCPAELWWSEGSQVAVFGDGSVRMPGGKVLPPPIPGSKPADVWVAEGGIVREAVLLDAKRSQKDGKFVYTAGSRSVTRDAKVENPICRSPGLVVPFEASPAGWTEQALLATTLTTSGDECLDLDVLDSGFHKPAWHASRDTWASCNHNQECDHNPLQDRADLKAVLPGADSVGFLAVGSGGVLFSVKVGDTPHAFAPVFWCKDPTCKDRTALKGLPPSDPELQIEPNGDRILVSVERSRDLPRLYELGRADPVWVIQGHAAWLPEGAHLLR